MSSLVSVIMATYNRSNILSYAIRCVLHQTLSEWELIVVGDGCTDDTGEIVAQFGDARIRFINLPDNVGEQSGPNNVGLRQARGQYIAFLNHDDFWFPDHLATALDMLQSNRADFVLSAGFIIQPDDSVDAIGLFADNRYVPNYFVPASGWVFRREVLKVVPNWRSYRLLWIYPSHDFLRRAFRAGLRMVPTNRFTFVHIPSGNRVNSYRDRQAVEHQHYFQQLTQNSNWRADLLTKVLLAPKLAWQSRGWPMLWQGFKNLLKQPFVRRGVVTVEWRMMLKYPRKGDILQSLRIVRGLPKL